MLTTEHPWTATTATETSVATTTPTYELRLHVGTDEPRLIAIPFGKHSVGSGPRSTVRLEYPGVQPLECLIVQDESGLRVRRWSDNTKLNGEPFDDSRLAAGDVLTVGPVELEVVGSQTESTEPESDWSEITGWDSDATPSKIADQECEDNPTAGIPATANEESFAEHAFELSPQVLQPTEPDLTWEESTSEAVEPAELSDSSAAAADGPTVSESEKPTLVRRRSGRRARTKLRKQRKQYNQLLARFDDLERKIEQSLAEPSLADNEREENPVGPGDENAAIEQERRQQEVESQLTQFRDQLTLRDRELQQARYSIDVLERQLIDSQRTMHAFTEERLTWESQFDELESRLANYVERIQELEHQSDAAQVCEMDAAQAAVASSTDWAEEPVTDSALGIDEVITETLSSSADDTSVADVATWNDTIEEPAAAETAPVEMTDVGPAEAPGVNPTPAEESPEVDAALDHLRGLSIWREEPQVAAEASAQVDPPVVDEPAEAPTNTPPSSFIDRYAHLFPSDDAPADPLARPIEPIRHNPPPVHETASVHAANGTEDEESVEQYMAKLLERMRGPVNPETPEEGETASAESQSAGNVAPATVEVEETAPVQDPITDLAELKTKPMVAEQASHRQAMRELAMQSARHAIGVHASRKLRRNTRTRAIIAVLGGAVAAYLLINAPTWKSLQFAAACVAGFVALYWGKLTLSTILEGIRLGAFDDYDNEDEIDADKSIHPPLPIDVETPAQSETEANLEPVEHADGVEYADSIAHADRD